MKKNKIYGYMVGYRELGSRFVRYYTTFTRSQALSSLLYYKKSPPRERETNRPLIDPVWEIQPITKKEIMRSILDEIPFLYKCIQIYLYICIRYSSCLLHTICSIGSCIVKRHRIIRCSCRTCRNCSAAREHSKTHTKRKKSRKNKQFT